MQLSHEIAQLGASGLDEGKPEQVPASFPTRPFVAVVSHLADAVETHSAQSHLMSASGTPRGCDALLPKPLSVEMARVLIEMSEL